MYAPEYIAPTKQSHMTWMDCIIHLNQMHCLIIMVNMHIFDGYTNVRKVAALSIVLVAYTVKPALAATRP